MAADDRLRRLAVASGWSRRDLVRYQRLNLIAVPEGEPSDQLLRRLRLIARLRRDLGLGTEATAVTVRLLDQLDVTPRARRKPGWTVRVIDSPSDGGGMPR